MTTPRDWLTQAAAAGLTARVRWRLRQSRAGHGEQHAAFAQLLPRLAATTSGDTAGLEAGMNYEQFRRRVPLRTYEDFAPDIERMKRGEPDVLWPGRCPYFAVSSGTTAGRTKYLPVTPELLTHFRHAGLDSLFYYTARTGRTDVFRGRHLFLGGSAALQQSLAAVGLTLADYRNELRAGLLAERLGSQRRGSTNLPAPFDHITVDIYGQSREVWRARR